jgi:predicted HTH transcriptional regulator
VNPPLNPKIDEIDVPNDPERKILIFTIDASNNAHTYKSDSKEISRYFIRTDYSTKEATNGFIRELLRRKGQIEPWDMRLEPKSSQLDIDQIVLRQYLQDMKLWRSDKSIDEYLSDTEKIEQFIPPLMGKIGFDKPACPKNFTLMVFGKDLLKFCECAYTIFAIYEGSDKSKPRSDTQWIAGTVVEQAKKIIELLNVESSSIAIDKERDSVNQFKYPAIALKEAVVNAIVHRDYEVNRPVRIEVYSNRIEIHSPGRLPFNIDVEKFRKGTATASWRNRSFARIFTRLDLAQSQGSGISRIIASMQEEGCPPPIFELGEEDVTCIVPAHPRHEIMRLLSEAESDIVVKDYINAYSKLEKVLSKDVYNYRALELFCELSILTGNVMNILHILIQDDIDFRKIRPNTLITLSDTLSTLKNSESASNISKQLLDIALTGRLEETQLIKGVITLRKLGENKKTVELIDEIFRYHSNLSNNSDLHDQKARSLIDLAKVCQDTFYSSTNSTLKERAKTDFKRYIEQAEKNLRIAYDNSESSISKDWIKNSMDYLENQMKPFLTGQE